MEHLSATPALTNDLSAYAAALAARVDRLEQQNRSQRHREHVHASVSGTHSDVGQHHHTVSTDCEPKMGQHKYVMPVYIR